MTKRRFWIAIVLVGFIFGVVSCGGDGGDNDLAPDSIEGQTYRLTLTNVTGTLGTPGDVVTFTFTASGTYIGRDPSNNLVDTGIYSNPK
jgi:hypothetical protein